MQNKNLHDDQLNKTFLKSYLTFFILIVFSIIIVAAVSFFSAKSALTKLGETALNNKIQMGLAMMDSLQKQVDTGKISKHNAQELFKSEMLSSKKKDGKTRALNLKLELGISAYMYAIDKNGIEMMHPFKEGQNSTDIAFENSNNVKEAIEQISGAINDSTKDMQNSFDNMKLLAENIDKVRSNSISMKNESASASNLNSNIIEVLTDLEHKNSQNIALSKDTNHKINKLLDKSNEIVTIINVIENISTEINLLSLNASIESARAGEVGKGFAVVAEQIKKLSNDTSNSVNKIRDLINELISTINVSTDSVKKSGTAAQSQIETIKIQTQ
jgi:methyl-accepting chemotaxis protein